MQTISIWISVCAVCFFPLVFFILKTYMTLQRTLWKRKYNNAVSVGFFHPYCNAGGGGERVLWCAVRAIQNKFKTVHCVIYTGDAFPGSVILENAERCFNIKLPRTVQFIHLKYRYLIEAKNYPYFTLLCQSLASVILGFEAAFKHVPDIYLDTMGYAWTYPIFKHVCSCRVGAYVHYPTISTDMLSSVSQQKIAVNNRQLISNSWLLTHLKLFYYKMFSMLYSAVGWQSEVIMVNSSWTQSHILKLWKKPEQTFIVYPPCDTCIFETLPLNSTLNKENLRIVSIAQFRPEKNHKLQLEAFKEFLDRVSSDESCITLVLIGSCRHSDDHDRVKTLKTLSSELGVEHDVEFKINLTFEEVIEEMKNADIALHSMWNEHFGIGIVECMSAGLVMIAHNSGGPKLDIITEGETGFLADDVKSYSSALQSVWNMTSEELITMRTKARESAARFSVAKFEESFLSSIQCLFRKKSI